MSAALAFDNLTLGYDRHPAVHHLHGEVKSGALIAVVGPNGAGKSTLFKGIVGMLKPLAGGIDLCGLRARDIAYLPQVADIDRTFPISVYDMVAMGLWREAGLFGGIGKRERDKVRDAMSAVGLSGFEERPIGTLSGGQMQRTLFARLLLQDGRVVVLDEPFNAVDTKTAADLLRSGAALARREAHRDRGAARSRAGQVDVSRGAAARARAGRLGRDEGCADGGESAQGAAHVRGVRRARRSVRRVRGFRREAARKT